MNGSKNNTKILYESKLIASVRFKKRAENTKNNSIYSSILSDITHDIERSMNDKDFLGLMDLLIVSQKHDANFFPKRDNTSLDLVVAIENLKERYFEGLDPDKVKSKFSDIAEELKLQRVVDKNFATDVRSITRSIGSYISPRLSYTENRYYETQQNALLAIGREHQKNIDRAMGYSRDKKKDKELSQNKGLTR